MLTSVTGLSFKKDNKLENALREIIAISKESEVVSIAKKALGITDTIPNASPVEQPSYFPMT